MGGHWLGAERRLIAGHNQAVSVTSLSDLNLSWSTLHSAAGEEAFDDMLRYVTERNFTAGEALSVRRDCLLAFHRLNVPSNLNVTVLGPNNIESVMGNARGTIGRVHRWRAESNQVARWMGVALMRPQSGSRHVRVHAQLGQLSAALARP